MAPKLTSAPRLIIGQRLQQIAYEFSGHNIPHWDTLTGRAQQEWAKKADIIIAIARRHKDDVDEGNGCVFCDLGLAVTRKRDKFVHLLTRAREIECTKLKVKKEEA